jgi:hypothetical protein
MKIDKSKFLVLTGVLAAGTAGAAMMNACTVTSTNNAGDGGTSSVDGSSGGTDGSSGGTDGSTSDAAGDGGGDAAATCLGDDKVLNPSCSSFLDAGTDGGSGCIQSANGQSTCNSAQSALKNGVARDVIQCLSAAPACEGGATPDVANDCVIAALGKACPDADTDAFCTDQLAKCTAGASLTKAQCMQYMAGLKPAARTAFATSCADEGGCALGPTATACLANNL